MLGREVSTTLDLMFEIPSSVKVIPNNQWVWILQERLETATDLSRQNTKQAIQRQKLVHNKWSLFETFNKSDKVLVYFPVKKVGTSSKFNSFWKGPFEVVDKISDVLYKVKCGQDLSEKVIHCEGQVLVGEPIVGLMKQETGDSVAFKQTDVHGDTTNVGLGDGDAHDCEIDSISDIDDDLSCRSKRTRRKPVWLKISISLLSSRIPQP